MKKTIILTIFILLVNYEIYAQSDIVYATDKYVMGDNDTKNDAKRICFLEAKRLCLEKAGTFLESCTEIINYKLTKDEIKTYASAILKVDIVSEEMKFIGENITIIMVVKAVVNANYIKDKIRQIKNDSDLEKKINEQQKQLTQLETKLRNLQRELSTNDIQEILAARKERKELFDKIGELEKIKMEG